VLEGESVFGAIMTAIRITRDNDPERRRRQIAYFLGIAVRMFFKDHDPPHFHARHEGFSARIRIEDRSW
jgi:hypothetical protein